MLCDDCRQKPATVQITKIVNNQKEELRLCEDCAKRYGAEFGFMMEPNFSLQNFLTGLLNNEQGWPVLPERQEGAKIEVKCPACNLTMKEFKQSGFLGCPQCYANFSSIIEPFLRKYHGNNQHVGKVPQRTGGVVRLRKEVEQLKSRLKQAIAAEEYEKAAQIRDDIRRLEKNF